MTSLAKTYIWQQTDWPTWSYDATTLSILLANAHQAQGRLLGKMQSLGFGVQQQTSLQVLTDDVLKTSEIEGEFLRPELVRSSVAKRLGIDIGGLSDSDRTVDGIVDIVMDATSKHAQDLSLDRLLSWHAALFPLGYSGIHKISAGQLRDDRLGPMQVISGAIGREKVHFEAPPASCLRSEITQFLNWFNASQSLDPYLKAGIAHLWFVTIHPFDDGNGRIGRAIADMALSRADQSRDRFYSLSSQIMKERQGYYLHLERSQKGSLDATEWLAWFLQCLINAIDSANSNLYSTLAKTQFWQHWQGVPFNERQIKLLNRLLDGFEGNLTNKKWSLIAKCSADTALRDITDLLDRGVLSRGSSSGRSTHYLIKQPERFS
ncbi:MAG: Fic family protein [Polynucleobacter sp.]|jgi:Fic family protein|nr:Fic family protein [Burkholderiaceae bacterium]